MTGVAAPGARRAYTRCMKIVPETTARRTMLGICVMTIVPLLQIATEYVGTGDSGRTLSKLAISIVGLPILIWGSSAGVRWAAGRRSGPLVLLVGGVLSAGTLYALLFYGMHLATLFIAAFEAFRPTAGAWTTSAALRIGFAMGLTNFGLWALAFVFPFAMEDARFRALEAQQLRTAAELARLRSHLEPHFLLNTLNAIAGLVTEDPRASRRLLASLGDLLRDSLHDEGEMQPLGEQIDWLRHYARILEERHAGQLAFRWDVAAETRSVLLPRLLLQPLVENAVKHGALGRKSGGTIEVRAQVVDAKNLVCTVEDNGLGIPAGKTRSGAFGLLSVRRRLALQYAERASFRLESSASGTRSIVEIPIEETRS
jgi:signal transduction histidine kinase